MRQIKFRAWDSEEKKMNTTGIIGIGSSAEIINIDFTGQIHLSNLYGLDFATKNPAYDEREQRFTPMQYTGLKDDNKVEIYEGDIIMFIDGQRASVEWNDDICQFQFSDGSPINNGERYSEYKIVIGNIYENPDLL